MTLPTALVIGPMKAGTSWIYQYLLTRQDVCLPAGIKETFYFDRYASRGDEWYRKHFSHYDPSCHKVIVEVAPTLFHSSDAPGRIRTSLGTVPLIVTLRDPIKRAWSHYMHLQRKGFTRKDLTSALEHFPEILDASLFDAQLERWCSEMPGSPLTVLRLEDLIADREAYTQALCEALDLPFQQAPEHLGETNAGGIPPSFLVAKLGRQAADIIRWGGGYRIVNFAKKVGLKDIFFGANGAQRIKPTEDEIALLAERLNEQIAWKERLYRSPEA
ncbi:sulfotransferase [Marivita sp.]|uniref:sulfotransferase n=1 Tax=Marivita sp. TaxID=2003365 RepID=UPI0025C3444D|nr:sulfotransferase [Marivita sp.]